MLVPNENTQTGIMDGLGDDGEKIWALGWEHFHRETNGDPPIKPETRESERKDTEKHNETELAAKARVQALVEAHRRIAAARERIADYVSTVEALHETETQQKRNFSDQTKNLSQGDASIISKLYVTAFVLKGDYIPSPQGFFASAASMSVLSREEKEVIRQMEDSYNRKLFAFHLRFMQEHGAQIPLPIWEKFLPEAIVAADIDPAIATTMGYDLVGLDP